MQYRGFGNSGLNVSRIGLGCYGMSGAYGAADETESIATIHRALELGVNLLDTSASYGQGHNHRLIGRAVRDRRDSVIIHSKTGTIRGPGGASIAEGSGTPDRLRAMCEESLNNLGIDCLDVFCMSRVDPSVPIEESVGGMGELVKEGKTRFIGLSECAAATLHRAAKVHPLTSLQYEYSLWSRDPESDHLRACRDLDLALMAYAPLGYGLLTGRVSQADSDGDTRRKFPRFQGENFAANRRRVEAIEDITSSKRATAAQVCLAWLLAQDDRVFPIPGCKTRRHLEENLAAAEIALAPADIAALDEAFPPGIAAGTRYPADGMKRVNL
jgi:aryl-alcohol dehydrogenase-like predicted oxidoreductase